jgi:hypothetical protein
MVLSFEISRLEDVPRSRCLIGQSVTDVPRGLTSLMFPASSRDDLAVSKDRSQSEGSLALKYQIKSANNIFVTF